MDMNENIKIIEILELIKKKQVNRHEQDIFENVKRLIDLIKWFQWQTELKTVIFSLE